MAELVNNKRLIKANVDMSMPTLAESFHVQEDLTVDGATILTGPLTVTDTSLVVDLNADMVDGYNAGNAPDDIPISNGIVCTNLNADLFDSAHKSIDGTFASNSDLLIPSQKAVKTYIGDRQFNPEARQGVQIYTAKTINSGIVDSEVLTCGPGAIQVSSYAIEKLAEEIVDVGTVTSGHWYIVYIDTEGVVSVEETTNTDSTLFPFTELDAATTINATGLARYKSTDSLKRAIAVAYSSSTSKFNGKKVINIPIETFGTGELGDVSLDGSAGTLGATATPFYGIEENTATTPVEHSEYNFNNLTLSGVCYCGDVNGEALAPVIIRVKGTLTIESGGQLNGDARGANGGAGGSGGIISAAYFAGGAGGAGAKSGRPIYIYANRIINKRTSGYWITCQAGNPSNGSNGVGGGGYTSHGGGGGGGGCQSSSSLIIITNSKEIESLRVNKILSSALGANGGDGGYAVLNGGGGGAGGITKDSVKAGNGGGSGTAAGGGGDPLSRSIPVYVDTTIYAGSNGYNGGGGGGSMSIGGGIGYDGGGGGAGFSAGANGGQGIGGGGGGGGGGNADATAGSAPTISHDNLGTLLIIENYSLRFGI